MRLQASDGKTDDGFGNSVAISGDTAIVGAFQEASGGLETGAAYIFERDQGGANAWGQVTKLQASDRRANALFGCSVAISGNFAIIGSDSVDDGFGAAYIFARNQGGVNTWGEVKKLQASDAQANNFGFCVSISGNMAIVGTLNGEAAYLFARDQGGTDNWGEVRKIRASDDGSSPRFGQGVAISGETAVAGAHRKASILGTPSAGAAYIFMRNEGGANKWGEVKKIAGDQVGGGEFGRAVALSGDTAVIGAPRNKRVGGVHDGAGFIFERNRNGANNWGSVSGPKGDASAPSDPENGAGSGSSVAILGDIVIVGAPNEDTGEKGAGAAFLFARNRGGANNWGEVKKIVASDRSAGAFFGRAVAIFDDTAIVGAFRADSGAPRAGAAYLFKRDHGGPDNWGEV